MKSQRSLTFLIIFSRQSRPDGKQADNWRVVIVGLKFIRVLFHLKLLLMVVFSSAYRITRESLPQKYCDIDVPVQARLARSCNDLTIQNLAYLYSYTSGMILWNCEACYINVVRSPYSTQEQLPMMGESI